MLTFQLVAEQAQLGLKLLGAPVEPALRILEAVAVFLLVPGRKLVYLRVYLRVRADHLDEIGHRIPITEDRLEDNLEIALCACRVRLEEYRLKAGAGMARNAGHLPLAHGGLRNA